MPRLSRTRDSVETPLVFSSVRVICVDEAANTVFAARNSNDDEILYCQRSQGEAVAIFVIDRGDIPDQASGLRVESDNVGDRKSTRLNSSHVRISYAVFCLQKKNMSSV